MPCAFRCSSMVNVTALSKRAVVRMRHSWPTRARNSMIVRRLWVTPAVGSLMQWLLTRRNRTTERTNRETARQHCSPAGERNMSTEVQSTEVGKKTQQLLHGSLKHVKAAALAALLVPLAAVAIRPAVASLQASG